MENQNDLHDTMMSSKQDTKPICNSDPSFQAASSSMKRTTSIGELLILEVFSGSCNLSSAFVQRGFQALAVDHTTSHKFRTLILDLTIHQDQLLLLEIISTQKPFLVWLAPPCGTASRARNIPAKNAQGNLFATPLRSDEFPDGLPDLDGIDFDRVLAANSLYELCENVCKLCDKLNIKWVIENPFDSYFWYTTWISLRHQHFQKFFLHNCMYGGPRPKRTGLLANFDLDSIQAVCDEQHDHAPWRSFSDESIHFHTSEEAAYPILLCTAIASLIADIAAHEGFSLPPQHFGESHTSDPAQAKHLLRGSVGVQPRGVQLSFLPSSFSEVWVVQSDLPGICAPNDKLPPPFIKGTIFPPELQFDDGSISRAQYSTSFDDPRRMKVLVPIAPKDYLLKVKGIQHPSQLEASAWGWYTSTVEELRTKDQAEYMRDQARTLSAILSRAKELSGKELQRRTGGDEVVKAVNVKKRLCLMDELLCAVNHPDSEIVNDLDKGFKLTGWIAPSGLFPKYVTPPQITRATLDSMSQSLNRLAALRCERNSSEDTAGTLLQITLEELDKGWIVRELSTGGLGMGDVLSPRFMIQQGEKSRAIDDFTFSNINSTVGTSERIVLQGVDEIASLAKHLLGAGMTDLVGRTYDMEAAYRQLPIHPEDRSKAIIGVFDPFQKRVRAFEMGTMPFGAIASVYSFLRTAAAVNNIGCSLLKIPLTSYFDDFTVITCSSLVKGTKLAVQSLFEVLGLGLSTSEKKNVDFAEVFTALGVAFDLHVGPDDSFSIKNTDARIKELLGRIDVVLKSGKLSGKEAKGLRSRLSFACSQLYGRTSASVMKDLGRYESSKHPSRLSGNTRTLLQIMASHLQTGMPRKIFFGRSEVVHIFTDGSLEESPLTGKVAGIGAVLVDELGNCRKAFSFTPRSEHVEMIGGRIHQLEILPVVMACIAFEEEIRSKRLFIHVDNSAAQSSLINAGSTNHTSRSLVYLYLDLEQRIQFIPWISRVNSASNVADGPSRNSFEEVQGLGAECFIFPEEVFKYVMDEFLKKLNMT